MVKLGLAFVFAGILGAGVELAVRAFISNYGSVTDVGLYNSGYMITITYASLVFASMETDYFPRLSAVNHDVTESNSVVNRQIEVSVVLLAPMLVAFMVALPIVIPLLYSGKFLPAIGMVRFGVIAMLLRAATLPMEYMSLAKGRSWIYLLTEAVYDAVVVGAILVGYVFVGFRARALEFSSRRLSIWCSCGLCAATIMDCGWSVTLLFCLLCRHCRSLRLISFRHLPAASGFGSPRLPASHFRQWFRGAIWRRMLALPPR